MRPGALIILIQRILIMLVSVRISLEKYIVHNLLKVREELKQVSRKLEGVHGKILGAVAKRVMKSS